jgi:Co/Zn/Cd efflux system component
VKFGAIVILLAIIISVVYGVLFSMVYPRVEIDGNIIGLFAILGLVTSLVVASLFRSRTTLNDSRDKDNDS